MSPDRQRSAAADRGRRISLSAAALAGLLILGACAGTSSMAGAGANGESGAAGGSPSASASAGEDASAGASPGAAGAGGLASLRAAADLAPCPAQDSAARPRTDGLPDVDLPCLGQPDVTVNLAKVRGTPMVVSIWGSWCPPCRAEVPAFESVWQQADGDVQFLGIDLQDDPARALAFAADVGMTYPSVSDPKAITRPELYFAGPPVTYFVNAEGRMTGRVDGQISTPDDLRRYIKQYLGIALPGGSG